MVEDMLIPEPLQRQPLWRLRVEDYERLRESGAFDHADRVELLHGVLVEMDLSDGPLHVWVTQRLTERLVVASVSTPVAVVCQSSACMGEYELPSPDIILVPRSAAFTRTIGGLLVAEVSGSTMSKDRNVKIPIYAEANVPEYWIIDLYKERVFVYTDPVDDMYRNVEVIPRTGVLQPRALPGVEIRVDELFRRD